MEIASNASRDPVDFVTVLNLTTTFNEDVGVRLEQAHHLLASRHDRAVEHAPLSLRNHLQSKRFVMLDLG